MTAPDPMGNPVARRLPVGRVILVVVGCLLLVPAVGMVLGGGALVWAHNTQRDADGFFTSSTQRLETITHAITSEKLDLGQDTGRPGDVMGSLATVRLRVERPGRAPVFVGIGPRDRVADYLSGVAHAEITDVALDPFRVSYRYSGGDQTPGPPGEQRFWVASAEGRGPQTMEWKIRSGQWAVVVMNADGSAGVGVDAAVGVKAGWIEPLGIALLIVGAVLLLVATTMLVIGVVGLVHHGHDTGSEEPSEPGTSPVRLTGHLDPGLGRWLWLVKWLLLIPHFVVLAFLWLAFSVLTLVSGVAILITGRYPRGIFDFNLGVLRWTWRVTFYAFGVNGTDRYPPFTLGAAPDYPAALDIAYPERLSRGLVLVKWWLLAIPQYLIVGVLVGGTRTVWTAGGQSVGVPVTGLNTWLVMVAVVVLLVTGRYPRGIFNLLVGFHRWIFRVIAYAALFTDHYPPFRLDQGPDEPIAPPADEAVPDPALPRAT